MTVLQIKLFGKFELKYTGLSLIEFGSSKAQELFCYILLHRSRAYLREALAESLWGKDPDVQSKKFMRQTLWEIQSTLKAQGGSTDGSRLLSVSSGWIELNTNLPFDLDVAEFERNFGCVQGIPIPKLGAKHIDALHKAEALYRGDLLEGWYWDWCAVERERFKDMYVTILEKLMLYCEISCQYELGLAYGMRMLSCDRALESAHQQLMRLYYLAGQRVKALRQFERCSAILSQELGVHPSQQTLRLYEQLKADKLDESSSIHTSPTVPLVPRLQDSLKQPISNLASSENEMAL
jgi:LuxR family maltose regulon positive regulatory protein